MSEYYGITTPTDDFIAHWGVKGMKWGVRKQKPIGNGMPKSRSHAYQQAQKKLVRSASIAGTIGGVAGGLAKGAIGGAIGGVAGSIIGGTASRIKNRELWKKGAPTKADYNRIVKNKNQKSKKPVRPTKDMNDLKRQMKAGGYLGGVGGSAVALARYKKQNPKQYEAFKKRYKQMGFKDRMKYAYSH